jgi:hypothetical protein
MHFYFFGFVSALLLHLCFDSVFRCTYVYWLISVFVFAVCWVPAVWLFLFYVVFWFVSVSASCPFLLDVYSCFISFYALSCPCFMSVSAGFLSLFYMSVLAFVGLKNLCLLTIQFPYLHCFGLYFYNSTFILCLSLFYVCFGSCLILSLHCIRLAIVSFCFESANCRVDLLIFSAWLCPSLFSFCFCFVPSLAICLSPRWFGLCTMCLSRNSPDWIWSCYLLFCLLFLFPHSHTVLAEMYKLPPPPVANVFLGKIWKGGTEKGEECERKMTKSWRKRKQWS